jgi:putative transposase
LAQLPKMNAFTPILLNGKYMSNYRRAYTPGGTYFFTVVTYERKPLLTLEPVRTALREAIRTVKEIYPFTIDAFVLLPNHLHCIWTLPPDDKDYSRRWSIIKRTVSTRCIEVAESTENGLVGGAHQAKGGAGSHLKHRELFFWQRRFWEHQVRDEEDFNRHIDYIHWNPVKHGYAKNVVDWDFSTFHRYRENGMYPADWGGCSNEDGEGYGE